MVDVPHVPLPLILIIMEELVPFHNRTCVFAGIGPVARRFFFFFFLRDQSKFQEKSTHPEPALTLAPLI